jgi:hypothetical protein
MGEVVGCNSEEAQFFVERVAVGGRGGGVFFVLFFVSRHFTQKDFVLKYFSQVVSGRTTPHYTSTLTPHTHKNVTLQRTTPMQQSRSSLLYGITQSTTVRT